MSNSASIESASPEELENLRRLDHLIKGRRYGEAEVMYFFDTDQDLVEKYAAKIGYSNTITIKKDKPNSENETDSRGALTALVTYYAIDKLVIVSSNEESYTIYTPSFPDSQVIIDNIKESIQNKSMTGKIVNYLENPEWPIAIFLKSEGYTFKGSINLSIYPDGQDSGLDNLLDILVVDEGNIRYIYSK